MGTTAALWDFPAPPAFRQTCCPPTHSRKWCTGDQMGSKAELSLNFTPSTQGRARFARLPCPHALPMLVPVTRSGYEQDPPHLDTAQPCSLNPPALPHSQHHPSVRAMGWAVEPGSIPMPQTIFSSRACHLSNTVPRLSCRKDHCHQPKSRGCAARGGCPSGPVCARPAQSCSRWPGDGARSPAGPAARCRARCGRAGLCV